MGMATCRCAVTAAIHLSHVRWTCAEYRKDMSWSNSSIGSLLKGMQKKDLRTRLAEMPENLRVKEEDVHRLVLLAWDLGDSEFGILALWAYHFLFSVADEAVPLPFGTPADAVGLPDGRHSGIWGARQRDPCEAQVKETLAPGLLDDKSLRLQEGGDSRLFPVHCMALTAGVEGHQIFPGLTLTQALHKLRRHLTLLSVPRAAAATL